MKKLPDLEQRNDWDYVTSYIPLDAVKISFILKKDGSVHKDIEENSNQKLSPTTPSKS